MFMRVVLPAPFSPRRAWISPGSTVRSTWSLATTPGKCLVIPLSSSLTAPRYPWMRGAPFRVLPSSPNTLGLVVLGVDGDRPADDPLLQLIQFALQVGGDLAIPLVEWSEADAIVLQRPQVVGAALERALHQLVDPREHCFLDVFLDAGQEQRTDLGDRVASVGVHPDDADVPGLLRGGRGPQPDVASHRKDDVGALGDEVLADRLALGLVGEVPAERSVLLDGIPSKHLNVRPLVLVVFQDAGRESVLEDRDRRDVNAAKRPDLARLERQAQHVRDGRVVGEVDDLEVNVRIGLGRIRRGLVQPEAHRYDHLRALLQAGTNVWCVILARL